MLTTKVVTLNKRIMVPCLKINENILNNYLSWYVPNNAYSFSDTYSRFIVFVGIFLHHLQ